MILVIVLSIVKSRFDEFGFRVEEEDGPEQNSKKLLGIPFVEDPQHRWLLVVFLYVIVISVKSSLNYKLILSLQVTVGCSLGI